MRLLLMMLLLFLWPFFEVLGSCLVLYILLDGDGMGRREKMPGMHMVRTKEIYSYRICET